MTIIYDAAGEDGDFIYMNGSVGANIAVLTAGGYFRAAYARCAISFAANLGNPFGYRYWAAGPQSAGWQGARLWMSSNNGDAINPLFGFFDVSGVPRILVVPVSGNPNLGFNVYKVDISGTRTQIGAASTSGFSASPSFPDQFSCQFDYAVAGSLKFYINSSLVFVYDGDITTNGVTELAGVYLGNFQAGAAWSEVICSDSDTRDMSVATLAASGAGTVDNWTGAYTNVNQIAVNDANFDTTVTAGAVQRYKISPLATGPYVILAKVTSLRATKGGGALANLSVDQLIGGTEYSSAAQLFPTAFGNYTLVEPISPATSAPWTQSEINDTAREAGYKATA
jgi:hypothetical protein